MDLSKKRVACLYRVSTKKQMDENDIPMQKNACREFISGFENWELTAEYYEKGVSGYHKPESKRDVLLQIKKDAENVLFDVLLVFMFDRLGRREDETPFIVEWLVEKGIEVWSVVEGQQRFESRTDKLINYIRYWQSGGESEKTSLRVSEKHRQMVIEGKFRGGSPPYGYKLVPSGYKNKKGYSLSKLIIEEVEAEAVKYIYHLAVNYGLGGYKIAQKLNEQNIPTKNGNNWTCAGVINLLKNPVYKGLYVCGKRKSVRGRKMRMSQDHWIFHHDDGLKIVSEDLWQKAEQIRTSRKKKDTKHPKQTKSPLILTGKLVCGGCYKPMSYRYNKKTWLLKTGEKKEKIIPQYICRKRSSQHICTEQHNYYHQKIDEIVLTEIENILECFDTAIFADMFEKEKLEQEKIIEVKLLELERQKKQVEKDLKILQNEILKALKNESKFNEEQLSACILKTENELSVICEKAKSLTLNKTAHFNFNSLDLKLLFTELPVEAKKMIIFLMIDFILIRKDSIDIYFQESFV